MPSVASLEQQQYYAHKANAFWPIMLSILKPNSAIEITEYSQRTRILIENRIAVWDVLQSCNRTGSLDTAIKMESIKVNDFLHFYTTHTAIKYVFFNGAKAESIYQKHVFSHLKKTIWIHKICKTAL